MLYQSRLAKVSRRSSSKLSAFVDLNDDIIDIYLNVATDLLLQACLHTPLIGGSCVL
jgi:hypothetical protein